MLSSLPFFKPTPESLVRKLVDLPPAPKVLHTLQRILLKEDTTIEDIAEVVRLEPGLSARVVRMAKSVHFGRGAEGTRLLKRSNESASQVSTNWLHSRWRRS